MRTKLGSLLLSSLAVVACLSLPGETHAAQTASSATHDESHVRVRLVANSEKLVTGKESKIAILFELEPGWHVYWKNPGDSGLPTTVTWSTPNSIKVSPISWPTPEIFKLGDLTSFGYEDQVLLESRLKPIAALDAHHEISANISWVLCRDECIPGETELKIQINQGKIESGAIHEAVFDTTSTMEPEMVSDAQLAFDSGDLHLRARHHDFLKLNASTIQFIPEVNGILNLSGKQKALVEQDGRLTIIAPTLAKFKPKIGNVVQGVIIGVDQNGIKRSFWVDPQTSAKLDPVATAGIGFDSSVAFAFASAFLGGLLLNLMPCVFPVFSLKVLALIEHAHSKSARLHMVMFVLGVMASFIALATALCSFRTLGIEVGWGFQFQSPHFVAAMVIITFVLGLNLAGLFEIGLTLQSKAGSVKVSEGYSGSFLSGVLATTLATPCTAPFMGSALAVALAAPLATAFGIFIALGLGMSLPYIIIAIWPAVARVLPRPGAWMESFKQAMAFPMFATSVWLLSVLGAQQGASAMTNCAAGLVLVSIAGWVLGRWGAPHKRRAVRIGARLAAVLIAIGSFASAMPHSVLAESSQPKAFQQAGLNWEPFSEGRLEELQSSGKKFLVDFTASWCLVCSVNHQRVFNRPEIVDDLRNSGVVLLRADWSTRDDGITRALRNLGKSGVPLVVLFNGENSPRQFDSLIDPAEFSSAIKEISQVG